MPQHIRFSAARKRRLNRSIEPAKLGRETCEVLR